jgi:hypothetical protein
MSDWHHIKSRTELEASWKLTASLDPAFANSERDFWESRTVAQLESLRAGAYRANDVTGYSLARAYLAIAGVQQ